MTGTGNHPLAGRYVLIDQIGAGGMGSVWRAWDLRTQSFLACKVLGSHDSGMLLRFVREQSVRITHPHVVAPHGWAAEDNLVVFTMDLVRGGSVGTLLGDHGPLPESYVAVLLDQTLQALEAVHAAGVVHRDVKPANLLLEPTGTRRPYVRLGDFGVAALIDEVRLTRFPGAIGTDGYMAPEQAHGAAPDPRQDLYSVGVVGIQLLTGLPPRQQKGVPAGILQPLLTALTDVDSEKRPASASDALTELRRLGVPPGAPWQSDPEPPEVFNQLAEVEPPTGLGQASAPSPFPTAPTPGPRSGGHSGPRSGGHSGPRSGGQSGGHSGALSGGQPGGLSGGQSGGHSGPRSGGQSGPRSGGRSGAPAPTPLMSPGAPTSSARTAAPRTQPVTQQTWAQQPGHADPERSHGLLVLAILCFLSSLGLSAAALGLILAG
jgi:serine/threonine protein kinase